MWVIADPASPLASYRVTAYLRGPDVEGLRGQVVAALATATIGK